MAKWQRMWDGQDNQEVGLEAAILERKRNSSLVEQLCRAEDVAGLKPCTEAADSRGQMTDDRGQTRTTTGKLVRGSRGVQAGVSDLLGNPLREPWPASDRAGCAGRPGAPRQQVGV